MGASGCLLLCYVYVLNSVISKHKVKHHNRLSMVHSVPFLDGLFEFSFLLDESDMLSKSLFLMSGVETIDSIGWLGIVNIIREKFIEYPKQI